MGPGLETRRGLFRPPWVSSTGIYLATIFEDDNSIFSTTSEYSLTGVPKAIFPPPSSVKDEYFLFWQEILYLISTNPFYKYLHFFLPPFLFPLDFYFLFICPFFVSSLSPFSFSLLFLFLFSLFFFHVSCLLFPFLALYLLQITI
jgi:hypothetical protein